MGGRIEVRVRERSICIYLYRAPADSRRLPVNTFLSAGDLFFKGGIHFVGSFLNSQLDADNIYGVVIGQYAERCQASSESLKLFDFKSF